MESQPPPAPRFAIGARVEGNWRGRGRWYLGQVTSAVDGGYGVAFDDGAVVVFAAAA